MTGFEELHDELRTVARDLLGKARGQDGDDEAPAGPDWRQLADAGWLGLEVAEDLGGAGATFAEVAVVLEEMGRAATPGPYLGTVVMGVGALTLLEPNRGRDGLLRLVATGDRTVAVALTSGEDDLAGHDRPAVADTVTPASLDGGGVITSAGAGTPAGRAGGGEVSTAGAVVAPFRLERAPEGLRLHGRASFVPDAPGADRLLLLALDPDTRDPVLVVVHAPPETPNLGVTPQPLLDATRRFGIVTANGVEVRDDQVWRFAGDPEASIRRLLDRGAVAVACDSLGLSEAMLEATVAYAGARHQFGRPIGSFQAVKHACADMLVQVSVARELVSAAVQALATGEPGASGEPDASDEPGGAVATEEPGAAVQAEAPDVSAVDASLTVSRAKSYACGVAVEVVGKALQLHGGIGYTWESGIHVYLKRAALNRSLLGSPRAHRKRLAERLRLRPVVQP